MYKNLLTLLIIGILFLSSCKTEDDVQVEKSIPVNIYKIQPDTISRYIKLTGSITGENDAIVYSKISEKLDRIYVKPGQKVNNDEVLAEQYNALLEQSVELAKAALKTAQAQYELVSQDYERMGELYKQKAVSPQQYDQAETQKKTAEAGLEQAKLQLEQANENYQNSFIKAPFRGIVGAVFFEENQMVPAGQPVVQIVNTNVMKSKLQLSSKDISDVSIGLPVLVKFPSIPGKEYKGKVININHAVNKLSNLLEIEVQLINPDNKIKSGIFGEFLIETATKKGTIVLPENSLMQRTEIIVDKKTGVRETMKKYFVFAVENGYSKLKEVKTGINSDGRIEILKGLENADTVIVIGQNVVRDGQKVKIVD